MQIKKSREAFWTFMQCTRRDQLFGAKLFWHSEHLLPLDISTRIHSKFAVFCIPLISKRRTQIGRLPVWSNYLLISIMQQAQKSRHQHHRSSPLILLRRQFWHSYLNRSQFTFFYLFPFFTKTFNFFFSTNLVWWHRHHLSALYFISC